MLDNFNFFSKIYIQEMEMAENGGKMIIYNLSSYKIHCRIIYILSKHDSTFDINPLMHNV